jgi:hypothetical protein
MELSRMTHEHTLRQPARMDVKSRADWGERQHAWFVSASYVELAGRVCCVCDQLPTSFCDAEAAHKQLHANWPPPPAPNTVDYYSQAASSLQLPSMVKVAVFWV